MTPGAAATQATQTSRTYTVSGLTAGTAINIDLVDAAQISGSTFALAPGNRTAALTFTPLVANIGIDEINGVGVGVVTAKSFTPTLSSLTFRVTSRTVVASEAVPVVFAGNTNVLNVNLDGVPTTQAIGIGGMVTFSPAAVAPPAEAANGVAMAGTVSEVVGSTGFRTGLTATQFVMRSGDTYQFGGTAITMAQFQSILSVGDTIGAASYINPTTVATPNTFNITTDLAFTAVAPVATSVGSLVTVKYTPDSSISANGTTVTLQRAGVVSGVTGPFATVKTGVLSSLDQQVFTETLADGTYDYKLIYTAPSFSGNTATSTIGTVTVSSTVTNVQPTIQRVYLTSNATAILTLSSGDAFKVVTDAPMVQPIVGATLTVGGKVLTNSVATATAAGSATFSVNTAAEVVDGVSHAAGTVLTVKLLADTIGGNVAFSFTGVSPNGVSAEVGVANAQGQLTGFGVDSTLTQDVVV